MTETVPIFTIPDEWALDSTVKDSTPIDTIVGTITPKGKELWLPQDPDKYKYKGGYSDGYSINDVKESNITLPSDMSVRFTDFFKKLLMKRNWADVGYSKEKYDCHWFAQWLDGRIGRRYSTMFTVTQADSMIKNGEITERPLGLGELGVLGCVSPMFNMAYAEHSMIGLDDTNALQVMGIHGTVAIAPQQETTQHYQEISESVDYRDTTNYGLYVNNSEIRTTVLTEKVTA